MLQRKEEIIAGFSKEELPVAVKYKDFYEIVKGVKPEQIVTDEEMVEALLLAAAGTSRKRMMLIFHEEDDEWQRMINVMWAGTYPRPHRHKEGITEEYISIKGEAAFVTFEDDGSLESVEPFGGKYGDKRIQVPEGKYHTVFALTPFAMHENKLIPGGWTSGEKEAASWAPEEGTPEAEEFLKKVKAEIQRLTSANT